jgi:isopentenyldiphosphate isomerase
LIATYDGVINLNPDVGYGYKWVDKRDLPDLISETPDSFTPWCKVAVEILKEKGVL